MASRSRSCALPIWSPCASLNAATSAPSKNPRPSTQAALNAKTPKISSISAMPDFPRTALLGPGPEPLVLVAAPADQVGVYPPQGAAESRPIEVAVVVDPALDVRIEHPRQIIQGLVAPSMECPSTNRLPYCLQRFRTCRRQERDAELPTVPDRRPRPKLIAEEVKRLDRIVSPPVRILAVDELRLLRMQSQPAGRDACPQGAPQCPRLFGASAVADDIVGVPLERDVGKVPYHP